MLLSKGEYPSFLLFLYLLVIVSPVTISEINILKGSTRLGTLGLPSLSRLKANQLQSTALDSDNSGVLVVVLNLVSDGLGNNIYIGDKIATCTIQGVRENY